MYRSKIIVYRMQVVESTKIFVKSQCFYASLKFGRTRCIKTVGSIEPVEHAIFPRFFLVTRATK